MLLGKSGGNTNEQNKCKNQQASIFRSIRYGHKKIDLYKYWYDYSKPEYRENCKLITWIQTPL